VIFRRRNTPAPQRDPLEPTLLLSARFKEENYAWVRRTVAEVGAGADYGNGEFMDQWIEDKRQEWQAGIDHELEVDRERTARRLTRSDARLKTLRLACDADETEIAHALEALDEARSRVRSTRRPVGAARRGGGA